VTLTTTRKRCKKGAGGHCWIRPVSCPFPYAPHKDMACRTRHQKSKFALLERLLLQRWRRLPSLPHGATQAGLRWQAPTACSIQVDHEIAEFCTPVHTTLLSAGLLVHRFLLFWESCSTLLLPSAQCQRLTGILAFTNRMISAFQPKKCQDGGR
jgi:hypothetical protein